MVVSACSKQTSKPQQTNKKKKTTTSKQHTFTQFVRTSRGLQHQHAMHTSPPLHHIHLLTFFHSPCLALLSLTQVVWCEFCLQAMERAVLCCVVLCCGGVGGTTTTPIFTGKHSQSPSHTTSNQALSSVSHSTTQLYLTQTREGKEQTRTSKDKAMRISALMVLPLFTVMSQAKHQAKTNEKPK